MWICLSWGDVLAISTGALSLLVILLIIGVSIFICKAKSSAKKVIKKDVNPLYGVDYEGDPEDKNPRLSEQNYDYMGGN